MTFIPNKAIKEEDSLAAPGARYKKYSQSLKEKFGEKVYKLPINLPGTCPNRDGTKGINGCIFCDEQGAGFDALSSALSIRRQIAENKEFYTARFGAKKFISYFQSYSNTYLPVEEFRKNLYAACGEDIVGISVSTRPDCVSEKHLEVLAEVQQSRNVDITLELGLQTVNYRTLTRINRGHTLAEFVEAVTRIQARNFAVCAHMILNLPWDDMEDVIEGAKFLSAFKVDYVKLHSLYVVEGTKLAEMYADGEIRICSLEEYLQRVGMFLSFLHPETVVQRLAAKGPRGKVLFCNWGMGYRQIVQAIEGYLESKDIWQGNEVNELSAVLSFVDGG